ncbi:MAG: GTPase ObgE [Eubacteriales bacterium]|nr:GTPase ObgE [Eubacteriales bacterium]
MFIDHASIILSSGKGGDGCISFHTAKYIPNGGPDGGNGGRGGHVYVEGDSNLRTLQDFRYKRKYAAENGDNGQRAKRAGKSGADLCIKVPLGTVLSEKESGRILADILEDGQRVRLCEGGRGGTGNSAYATSTRQAPRFAKAGEAGITLEVNLELKLLADIAIIGMPNVGKSTFLSVVTRAKPEIADYHFTTIQPKVGIASVDDYSFALADVPGLIEGASAGLGLGFDFLRHIERSRLLLHILDASGHEGRDPYEDFCIINREIETYNPEIAKRPQIVALNKLDMAEPEDVQALRSRLESEGYEVYEICAPIHMGTDELLHVLASRLKSLPAATSFMPIEMEGEGYKHYKLDDDVCRVHKEGDVFVVEASWLDRFIRSINFEDYSSLHYFQKTLKRRGVIAALEAAGINPGDTVQMEALEFDYYPEDRDEDYELEDGELDEFEDAIDALEKNYEEDGEVIAYELEEVDDADE